MAQKSIKPFQNKLLALDYHSATNINIENPTDLKALTIWLEDQKIRHYKIENRTDLRNNTGDNWVSTFKKYCNDLECPYDIGTQLTATVDWLLGVALKCEYCDAAENNPVLRTGLGKQVSKSGSSPLELPTSGTSPLDVNPSDQIFHKGVNALARILLLPSHPDTTVLLAACRMVIEEKLNEDKMKELKANPVSSNTKKHFKVTPKECGFDIGDPVLAEAAKVLRLLHIQELRHLQTCINELIVDVQRITADPKTDQSLGQVGR